MTCGARGEGGDADGDGEEGTRDGLVTEPKENHAQQNSKNNGQNEANDQQWRKRPNNVRKGARVHHIPRDRSQVKPD